MNGDAVTDAGLSHLHPLRHLRTLVADFSRVTEAGADRLAEQLLGVTIIAPSHVAKSPRASMVFVRRPLAAWVSALLPEHWMERGSCFMEDGWESLGIWSSDVRPAQIRHDPDEVYAAETAEDQLDQSSAGEYRERGLVEWAGWETASAIREDGILRLLVCATVRDGRSFTLTCQAPPSRFDSFLPLFLFVARSVRLGDATTEERVEIPTSDLA